MQQCEHETPAHHEMQTLQLAPAALPQAMCHALFPGVYGAWGGGGGGGGKASALPFPSMLQALMA